MDRTQQPLRSDVTTLPVGNMTITENQRKILNLEEENSSLKWKLRILEHNQEKTKSKVDQIENRLLEGNVVMHGLGEEDDETSMQLYEKLVEAMSYTINRCNKKDRIETAKGVSISTVK